MSCNAIETYIKGLWYSLVVGLMALIDFEAAFEKRCDEIAPWLFANFQYQGIETFSTLAFAVGTPQQPCSEQEMQRFSDRIVQGPASLAELSAIKRIHFEATTLLMVDLKRQATAGDTSEPSRSKPYVEKKKRLEAQQQRITGLSHRHEQKASHALIDFCFHIVESGALVYVPPSKCTSRDSEVQADVKQKQKQFVTLEQGALKTVVGGELQNVDVGSELKLMYAFQRRGLAFDLVGLMSWETRSDWVNKLFRAFTADVPQQFQSLTLQHILKADQELFILLAEENTGSLKAARQGDPPPLDAFVAMLMNDPRINIHLVPSAKVDKRPANQMSRPETGPSGPKGPKRPKTSGEKATLPSELEGLHVKSKDGKPMCWSFNLKRGCSNSTKKGRCRFGLHVCMKCLKVGHGASSCTGS